MRVSLLVFAGKEREAGRALAMEWEKYRQYGVMLLFMNQVLTAIVVLVVVQDKCFEYTSALIYMMAAYAFCAFAASVKNMVEVRKYASPVMTAARMVGMTAALVSILSLATVMLAHFGDPGEKVFRRVLLSITGGAVCTAVLGKAVYMIARATAQLKKGKSSAASSYSK